jgi:hypothetical protein
MLDLCDGSHVRMQCVEQIEDMSAAARAALDMSDDDILAVKIGRVEIAPADERMSFREHGQ